MNLYQERITKFVNDISVYPVSCETLCNGRSDYEWLEAVLAGGAKIVQLRDKLSNDRTLLQKARYFREKTNEAGALFIVNDRVDIALLSNADGIHIGQNDIPPNEIKKLAPDFIIGLSCNSKEQAKKLGELVDKGNDEVSYFNIGPIYATKTKNGLTEFIGTDSISSFSSLCNLPFTVMGGIKWDNLDELREAGASRIAVVTALSKAEDIKEETKKWVKKIGFRA